MGRPPSCDCHCPEESSSPSSSSSSSSSSFPKLGPGGCVLPCDVVARYYWLEITGFSSFGCCPSWGSAGSRMLLEYIGIVVNDIYCTWSYVGEPDLSCGTTQWRLFYGNIGSGNQWNLQFAQNGNYAGPNQIRYASTAANFDCLGLTTAWQLLVDTAGCTFSETVAVYPANP